MSKKTSPGEGSGSNASPRSGSISRNLVYWRVFSPPLKLDSGLVYGAFVRFACAAFWIALQRSGNLSVFLQSCNVPVINFTPLTRRHSGDEG